MSTIDLINTSVNPLNEDSIKRIIELYSMNNNLTSSVMGANKRNNSRINMADKEELDREMFLAWKDEILNLSDKEAMELFEECRIDKDFKNLRNFLIRHKDVESSAMFRRLCIEEKLEKTYDAYRWDSKGLGNTPYTYVTSNKIWSHKEDPFRVQHDIYINTNCDDTYFMANEFRKKCESEGLPYLFKVSESPFRDDSIIIYASDELVERYMEILGTIKEENPELASRINVPPLLTSKVDYYGYGSEPSKGENGRNRSYNVVRTNIIEDAIADSARRWFYRNRGLALNGFTIYDAMVKECYLKLTNSMTRNYNNACEYERELAKKNKTEFSEEIVKDRLGYSLELLGDPEFQSKITTNIKFNIPHILKDEELFTKNPAKSAISIPLDNGKTCDITYGDVARIVKRNAIGISKLDSFFAKKVLETVMDKCEKVKISKSNFALSSDFDAERVKKARAARAARTAEKNRKIAESGGGLQFPKFDTLKDLAAKYRVEYNKEINKLQVLDIATNAVEEDAKTAQDALFANIWLSSTGLKPVQGEKRPGLTDAFDVDGAILYKYFVKACQHSLDKTGNVNSLFIFKNSRKLNMSGADDMVARLFNNDSQSLFIDSYVHSRLTSGKPRTKGAETLVDLESASKRLDAAMDKKRRV